MSRRWSFEGRARILCLVWAVPSLVAGCGVSFDMAPPPRATHANVAGRYAVDRFAVVQVRSTGDTISVVPPFWTSRPYFVTEDGTTFLMDLPHPRPDRIATFAEFESGRPGVITLTAVDDRYDGQAFRRLEDFGDATVAELLLAGKPAAADELARAASTDPGALAEFSLRMLLSFPSAFAATADFLGRLSAAYPEHARLRSLYGHALVAVARRAEAESAFVKALALDPEDATADEGLRRLRTRDPAAGTGYRAIFPFTLHEAYAAPDAAEIAHVRRLWDARDLAPYAATVVARSGVTLSHGSVDARVIRHRVGGPQGDEHFGIVFVPQGAAPGSLLPVLDARGVNPTFSPRDVTDGTTSLRLLGAAQRDFAVLVPCFRGNTLILDGAEYVSGGDPSDAWDGATDDALAFLNAALQAIPEIAPGGAAIFGHSRGGTVALLAGERDARIELVLAAAGPVDHFAAMNDYLGWTRTEVLTDVMRAGAMPQPTEEGGQVLDHFFDRVPAIAETLADVRARLLASSPLYFAEDLPRTHAYYGAEDRSVPLRNATLLQARMAGLGRRAPDFELEVFEGCGHDTDPLPMQRSVAAELIGWAASRRP